MRYSQLKTEILSGLTISAALVPEAISFALLVGVFPQAGLWAAFFMALSTSLFGGRPGLISGATGATAVILAGLVHTHGDQHLYLAVFVAGLIQLVIWATGGWRVFKFIPKVVVSAFLISLALLIFQSQLKYLTLGDLTQSKLLIFILIIAVSAIAMYFSSKLFKFPPAISAIVIGSLLSYPFDLPIIGDLSSISNSLPQFSLPEFSISSILLVLPYSIGMALSGLVESLIAVDDVSTKLGKDGITEPKSRETLAQSIGNMISGLFSSIGGCVLIGQTNLNVSAGAKHRLSSLTASIGLLLIILLLGEAIQHLPLAGLIGVMMIVVYQTGDWEKLKIQKNLNFVNLIFTIIVSVVSHNLALGIIVGTIVHYSMKKISNNGKEKDRG
jgi:SulP family sulfate permease